MTEIICEFGLFFGLIMGYGLGAYLLARAAEYVLWRFFPKTYERITKAWEVNW